MKKSQSMAEGLKVYISPLSKIITEMEKLEPHLDGSLMEDFTAAKKLVKDYTDTFSGKISKFDNETSAAKSIMFKQDNVINSSESMLRVKTEYEAGAKKPLP